jgi:hypothetical protein
MCTRVTLSRDRPRDPFFIFIFTLCSSSMPSSNLHRISSVFPLSSTSLPSQLPANRHLQTCLPATRGRGGATAMPPPTADPMLPLEPSIAGCVTGAHHRSRPPQTLNPNLDHTATVTAHTKPPFGEEAAALRPHSLHAPPPPSLPSPPRTTAKFKASLPIRVVGGHTPSQSE